MKSTIKFLAIASFYLIALQANAQCNTCSLTGNTQVISGLSSTFSIPAQSGASFFWSVTGNLTISGSNTGSSVNVIGGSIGAGKVCVTRFMAGSQPCCSCIDITVVGQGNSCPSWSTTFTAFNMITGIPNTVCPGDRFAVSLTNSIPPGYYVQWSITPSIPASSGSISNTQASYLEFTDVSQYSQNTVSVAFYCNNGRVSGIGQSVVIRESIINCNYTPSIAAGSSANIYPNPATNELSIELPESKLSYECVVLNSNGDVKYRAAIGSGIQKINISNFDKGVFYLKLFRTDNWVKQLQFIKE